LYFCFKCRGSPLSFLVAGASGDDWVADARTVVVFFSSPAVSCERGQDAKNMFHYSRKQANPRASADTPAPLRAGGTLRNVRPVSSLTLGSLDNAKAKLYSSFSGDDCFPEVIGAPVGRPVSAMDRQMNTIHRKKAYAVKKKQELEQRASFTRELRVMQSTHVVRLGLSPATVDRSLSAAEYSAPNEDFLGATVASAGGGNDSRPASRCASAALNRSISAAAMGNVVPVLRSEALVPTNPLQYHRQRKGGRAPTFHAVGGVVGTAASVSAAFGAAGRQQPSMGDTLRGIGSDALSRQQTAAGDATGDTFSEFGDDSPVSRMPLQRSAPPGDKEKMAVRRARAMQWHVAGRSVPNALTPRTATDADALPPRPESATTKETLALLARPVQLHLIRGASAGPASQHGNARLLNRMLRGPDRPCSAPPNLPNKLGSDEAARPLCAVAL
jgi:hypothetical protein